MKTIILGARGSQLALAQAELAKQAVERLPGRPEAIIRITTTTGDRRLDINLSQPGGAKIDKGLGGDLCCEAIFFDESEKPRSGIVSGAFHTPREAASALLDKIYETAK